MRPCSRLAFGLASLPLGLLLIACGGSTTGAGVTAGAPDSAAADAIADGGPSMGSDAATDSTTPPPPPPPPGADASGPLSTVSFEYTPQWSGVTSVAVIGGFGQATDWMPKSPLVTLTSQSQGGKFTGSVQLPAGTYLYVFLVTGDAAASKPSTYTRYVMDPTNPAFVAVPQASPTFDKNAVNPCSELTVPQPAAAPLNHLKGTVTYDGAPKSGYLVLLERNEPMYHHFAVNRTDTASDGTFDCVMAPGKYRVQVLYPTYLSQTDADRNPLVLQALRRSISGTKEISATTTFEPVELADHDYDKLSPVDAGALPLPVTFTYTVLPSASAAQLQLYGPGASIGDPWYTGGAYSAATSAVFDGGFNTTKATTPSPEAGTSYWWGTSQQSGSADGGVVWEGETMVFPIQFQ
jgi:hypothetical protein